jgi:uncharacterized protein with PQ loop repeat
VHLGELAGWASVALGQLVSWPQVIKLRRERGEGVSLASYAIVNVSMTLFFVHAIGIGDTVSMVSVPVSMVPNVLIATTLLRRRRGMTTREGAPRRVVGRPPRISVLGEPQTIEVLGSSARSLMSMVPAAGAGVRKPFQAR